MENFAAHFVFECKVDKKHCPRNTVSVITGNRHERVNQR